MVRHYTTRVIQTYNIIEQNGEEKATYGEAIFEKFI
jgi:hypothetical protein